MIEACAAPVNGRVTQRAVFREIRTGMARTRSLVVIGHVTAFARGWDRLEISGQVALPALNRIVRTRQCEARSRRVIKAGRRPSCGCVTQRAIGWEASRYVVGIGSCFEVVKVACCAILRSAGKAASCVALVALHTRVCANKRECGLRVIECRVLPGRRRVALGAIRCEASLDVVRIIRVLKILLVAANASRRRPGKLSVFVASRACHVGVSSCQRKSKLVVVHLNSCPTRSRMALRTVSCKLRRRMWRIRSVLKICLMAANASGGSAHKASVDVARSTRDCHVCARQWEVGERVVIKLRVHPAVAIHAVALRTVDGETQGLMGRILSAHEIVSMAANAFGAQTGEHGCARTGMACLARDVSMRTE